MKPENASFERCRRFIDSNFVATPAPTKVKRPRAVAISRQYFSRSHAIGEELIRRLKNDRILGLSPWVLFDEDLVEKVLEDHELPKSMARYMPEDKDHDLKGLLNEILGVHPSLWELFHYTCDTILKLARVGNVILMGRGAHIIARNLPHVLHVRIVAPEDFRVENACRELKISHEKALNRIRKEDNARAAYVSQHFSESIKDPQAYHMILNTGQLSVETAAALMHDALRSL